MTKLLLPSLLAAAALAGCGGVSIPRSPELSCESRGCERALDAAAETLSCPPARVLVRDLGVDRYRAVGCGGAVVLDCAEGCRPSAPVAALDPRAEVAYRASFELLCAPSVVDVAEIRSRARGANDPRRFVATCRGVGVRYACHEGCERLGPLDEVPHALRQREPEALACLARSRAEMRVSFDSRGKVVRVDADGIRPVRMRGFERDHEATETKQECIRSLFERLPAFPAYAGTDLVFPLGGPGARRPAQLSVLAPPAASEVALEPPPAPPPTEATQPATAPSPTSPEQEAAEAALRAALDARAGAILACTETERAVLEIRAAAEGPLEVALRGPLAGSPEEGCVRTAVGAVARPPGLGAGTVVHLVEARPAPAP